jgi:hypothetical protein
MRINFKEECMKNSVEGSFFREKKGDGIMMLNFRGTEGEMLGIRCNWLRMLRIASHRGLLIIFVSSFWVSLSWVS